MKKIHLIFVMFFLFCSGITAQTISNKKYLKPTNFQKRVTTLISEKSRSYYSLNTDEASIISVKGPGVLRVLTRGRFVPDEGESIKYEVLYTVDGGEQEKVKISSVERSKKATYLNGALGVPGQLKDFEIELGRGNHSIEFYLKEAKTPVAVRYIYTPTKAKKQDWIAFSPLLPSEPVDLISRETTVNYYRFTKDMPLMVEINGPTELRVLTRVENHYQMKGRIHYRVQVKEDGVAINTYQLSSRPSEIAEYKKDKELVPGKACEFVIYVARGRHHYEISPLDEDKSSLLGRLLMPEKDTKLEN